MPVSELDNDATRQPDSEGGDAERRRWPRVSAERLAQVAARLSTGADVRLVDLSRGGARLETDRRMLPNSTIALKLLASDAQFVVTGRVVRSRVIRLSAGGLGYDVAVSFNEPLHQFSELPEAGTATPPRVQGATPAPIVAAAVAPTPELATSDPGAAPLPIDDAATPQAGDDDVWPITMIHVTATVDRTSDELIDLFDESSW
jgi:hypothetical protein